MIRVRDGAGSFRGAQVSSRAGPVLSLAHSCQQPCVSPPQLTVYLGKRDFVDHIDLVDPVGESWRARRAEKGVEGKAGPGLRRGLLSRTGVDGSCFG